MKEERTLARICAVLLAAMLLPFSVYAQDTDLDSLADTIDHDDDNDGILDSWEWEVIKVDFSSAGDSDGGSLADWNQITTNAGIPVGSVVRHGEGSIVPGVSISVENINPGKFNNDGNTRNWPGLANDPYYIPAVDDIYYHSNAARGALIFNGLDPAVEYNVRIYSLISETSRTDNWSVTDAAGTQSITNSRSFRFSQTDLDSAGLVFDRLRPTASGQITVLFPSLRRAFPLNAIVLEKRLDTDGDGIDNALDLDSDNDGITDNVEAQSSAGYQAPSGSVSSSLGVDIAYGATGLIPVNTDAADTPDYIDSNSDNEGAEDIAERGDGGPSSLTSTADTDNDGLYDIFEGATLNDRTDVNDENIDGAGNFAFADSDNDVNDDGSGASPPFQDFDYRDSLSTPAELTVEQTFQSQAASGYFLPREDLIYSLKVSNTGGRIIDADSIFVVDSLPDEVTFFNGDYNGAESGSAVIGFTNIGSNLTFDPASDVAYSSSLTPPTSFAQCTYTPTANYDSNVRHICFNPKGVMLPGSPEPQFIIEFRVRLD